MNMCHWAGVCARGLATRNTVVIIPANTSVHQYISTWGGYMCTMTSHTRSCEPDVQRRIEMAAQGDVSPQSDPDRYMSAVQSLYNQYLAMGTDAHGRWPPLVVNTHGWVKGLGLELLAHVLRVVQPTHLVHVSAVQGYNCTRVHGRGAAYRHCHIKRCGFCAVLHTAYSTPTLQYPNCWFITSRTCLPDW